MTAADRPPLTPHAQKLIDEGRIKHDDDVPSYVAKIPILRSFSIVFGSSHVSATMAGLFFLTTPKSQGRNTGPSVVYSGESSHYFGYQAQSNYYGFLTSGQHPKGDFMRLQTCSVIDDMSSYIPTFTAKRYQYSKRYGPFNKADVLVKWFNSAMAPTQDIVVVIDPDNWIIKDIWPNLNLET